VEDARVRILLVSSFVVPHAGGVEQFVQTVREMLEAEGCEVRVLACRRRGEDATADAVVPARYLGPGGWPLPVAGWRTIWREVAGADAVVANVAVQPLSVMAVAVARLRGVPRLLVVHGSGQPRRHGARAVLALRALFMRAVARPAMRHCLPVSVSVAGVEGAEGAYGVRVRYLPYPLAELPTAEARAGPADGDPLRLVWVGRLAPEKDPLLAVRALDRLRDGRHATLDVYGSGPLSAELARLGESRPWLTLQGSRPWPEVLAAQARGHACLSTSRWDNVQVAVLEALARGVPVISTRVGDASRYYSPADLGRFCVPPGDPAALAGATAHLAAGYDEHRRAFAENGARLRAVHRESPRILMELIADAGAR
jgi:glycosyltransferase involved in cell wall biosynthesis